MEPLTIEKLHLLAAESEDSFSSDGCRERQVTTMGKTPRYVRILVVYTGLLLFVISIATNVALSLLLLKSPISQEKALLADGSEPFEDDKSSWLGLKHDHPRLWRHNTLYSSANVSESDTNWINMDIDYATIALSKEEVARLNLPEAGRVPWAPEYFMYGVSPVHALHCLKFLHRSNMEYRHDMPQTYAVGHLLHCLDVIRDQITCTFDDMPLGLPLPGVGPNTQYRQCKDWSKLEKFAKEHAICVTRAKKIRPDSMEIKPDTTEIYPFPESGRYCPPDSPLLPSMRKYFHQSDDWVPPRGPSLLAVPPGVQWEGYDHERSAIDGL